MSYLIGDGSSHAGARDPRPPRANGRHHLEAELFFAGRSTRWDGAVAYCDPNRTPDRPALGRRWLLSVDQVSDIARQENRVDVRLDLDLLDCRRHGHADLTDGRYGRALWLGEVDGIPAITITSRRRVGPVGPAATDYLVTIARGLIDAWGLSPSDVAHYLATRPGNRGVIDPDALAEDVGRELR